MTKRETFIPLAPIRRLMREECGIKMASRKAVRAIVDELERYARRISETAYRNTKHAKRKKVDVSDVTLALRNGV